MSGRAGGATGRARARRAWFAMATALGIARRGFFIPYRYAARLPGPGERATYPAAEALFAAARENFAELLDELAAFAESLHAIGEGPPPAPRWSQDWFPRLDAAVAYGLVRRHAPAWIVEVGSGHSTRFLAQAVADGGLTTRIAAIDPEPRASLTGLDVAFTPTAVPEAGEAPFRDLQPGDFLVVDSSHILMPGSDADFLLGRVLPGLPAGAIVHLHDIFLPDDYPAEWDWRGYNEQLGVLQLLLGGRWEVLFASHYVATRMAGVLADSVVARLPLSPSAYETSLWLRKRSAGQ